MNTQQKIKDLENQIEALKAQEQARFYWENAPIICELNGYRWLLGTESDDELSWQDAKAWCQSVGGELPPRDILLQCFMNEGIKSEFKTEWHWSSTEFSAPYAWKQSFYYGNQSNFSKDYCTYVRAVRKVLI